MAFLEPSVVDLCDNRLALEYPAIWVVELLVVPFEDFQDLTQLRSATLVGRVGVHRFISQSHGSVTQGCQCLVEPRYVVCVDLASIDSMSDHHLSNLGCTLPEEAEPG